MNEPTCDLAIVRSGAWPVMVTLALLFAATGSVSFSAVLVAVFVSEPVDVTVAVRSRVTDTPLATAPMSHTPVPLVYVPWLGVAETNVSPAGSWSVICTPVASEGPLLVTVIVKVTFDPSVTVPLLASLATAMSARETTFVRSVAVSFAVSTSPPPETVAVLVTELAADCATFTVIEIAGNDPLLATTSVLVHVAGCATIAHDHPVPDAAVGVSPAGSVSVTVVVPLVAVPPMLLTVNP